MFRPVLKFPTSLTTPPIFWKIYKTNHQLHSSRDLPLSHPVQEVERDHLQAEEGQQAQHLDDEQFDDPPVQLVYQGDTLQSVVPYSLKLGLDTVPVHEQVDEVDELLHLIHHMRPPDFRNC